jgi:hypothetical protein
LTEISGAFDRKKLRVIGKSMARYIAFPNVTSNA